MSTFRKVVQTNVLQGSFGLCSTFLLFPVRGSVRMRRMKKRRFLSHGVTETAFGAYLPDDSHFIRLKVVGKWPGWGRSVASEGLHILAQDVADEEVCQTAGADAEVTVAGKVFAQDFGHDGVEVNGFGHCLDATGSFKAD